MMDFMSYKRHFLGSTIIGISEEQELYGTLNGVNFKPDQGDFLLGVPSDSGIFAEKIIKTIEKIKNCKSSNICDETCSDSAFPNSVTKF